MVKILIIAFLIIYFVVFISLGIGGTLIPILLYYENIINDNLLKYFLIINSILIFLLSCLGLIYIGIIYFVKKKIIINTENNSINHQISEITPLIPETNKNLNTLIITPIIIKIESEEKHHIDDKKCDKLEQSEALTTVIHEDNNFYNMESHRTKIINIIVYIIKIINKKIFSEVIHQCLSKSIRNHNFHQK